MEVSEINRMGISELMFIVLTFLFVLEQIFYYFLGAYPYRYGFLIKTVSIAASDNEFWHKEKKMNNKLAIKIDEKKGEIYIHYKYWIGGGPLLFIGQIQNNSRGKLKVRLGPLCAIFLSFLVISPLFHDGFYSIINSLGIIAIIVWFYFRFIKNVGSLNQNGS